MTAAQSSEPLTLLVVLAHPDDEIAAVAAMLAQRARGDRVVLCWLTRGEMTEAFGPVGTDEVIARRLETGKAAGEILDVETRFLEFHGHGRHAPIVKRPSRSPAFSPRFVPTGS